jgi:carbamoyltransferase
LNPTGSHQALCAAGGVFLNCQMNGRILTDTKFRKVHVVPAAGDDGLSVGAAFHTYAHAFGTLRRGSHSLPFLGKRYGNELIQESLDHFGLKAELMDESELADRMAEDLDEGRLIGLLRGRSEMGPRALCHRSILADPRVAGMKDRLNSLKGREPFRPFAPVVTEEDQFKYFELAQLSPYMLFATRLRSQFKAALPAIVHVDGSSRVQAVNQCQEPFVHLLLRAFESRTAYPILLNTSFNLAHEPIVESPSDAIVCYLTSDIDTLAIERFYVNKKIPLVSRRRV